MNGGRLAGLNDKQKTESIDEGMALRKYIHDDLRENDVPLFYQVSLRFILDVAIWIDPEDYKKYPIIEPLAYREQRWKALGWKRGQANPDTAQLVDGNSHNKNYMNSAGTKIVSRKVKYYNNKKLVSGSGFVACHIWDEYGKECTKATGDHRLFTFIPNIVWLPKEIAYLTDIKGTPVRDLLKQLSVNLYHSVKISNPELQSIIEENWDKLLEIKHNDILPPASIPSKEMYNLMTGFDAAINKKKTRNKNFAKGLIAHGNGQKLPSGVRKNEANSSYWKSIPNTDVAKALELGTWLEGYLNALP